MYFHGCYSSTCITERVFFQQKERFLDKLFTATALYLQHADKHQKQTSIDGAYHV
jgi:hypothetical protein